MRLLVFSLFLLALVPFILRNPYIGVLLYSWVSFMSPHRLIWNFPETIPLAMITAIMTLLSWAFSREDKKLHLDLTSWLFIAFLAYICLTTLLALNPEKAVSKWELTAKSLLFVLVTIQLTTNRIRFHALLWVMIIAIGFYGLKAGIFTVLNGGAYLAYGPPDTAIADNNDFAAGLTVALPLINYVRLSSNHRWVRISLLVVMAASVLAVTGSYSRGGLLGLVAVSGVLWLKSRNKFISGILIAFTVVSAVAFMPERYVERIMTIETYQEDSSAMGRITIWGAAINIALARPLTGGGFKATESQAVVDRYDQGVNARAVHNVFFAVLGEHGFVAFLIWIALPIVAWRNSRRLIRLSEARPQWQWAADFARMSQASLAAYVVVGSFGNYAYWDYYFTLIGLLAAVRYILEQASLRPSPLAASTTALSPATP